jgi:hypothetical protein
MFHGSAGVSKGSFCDSMLACSTSPSLIIKGIRHARWNFSLRGIDLGEADHRNPVLSAVISIDPMPAIRLAIGQDFMILFAAALLGFFSNPPVA